MVPLLVRVQYLQVLVYEPAVLLDQDVVKPDLAVGQDPDQVPMHRRTVAVVTLVVGLARCEVDRAVDLFVKEDIAHGLTDAGVDAERELADVAGPLIAVQDLVEGRTQAAVCGGLDDPPVLELEAYVVVFLALVDAGTV